MKNLCAFLLSLSLSSFIPFTANCQKGVSEKQIVIKWNDEKQLIDGFGAAQAGWAHSLYAHYEREKIMDLLFGNDGLRLSILRGEVFPFYWENENDKSFKLDDDIYLPLDNPLFDRESDDLKRRGQHWITKLAKEKYQVDKLLFSTWSAPAYMKSNRKQSGGHLRRDYYQAFADYLADFYKAYKSIGLEPYAISPSNEPGYAAPWSSSVWSAEQMGEFLVKHLGPTFQKEGVASRIVFGENPFWAASTMLTSLSSEDFVNTIIEYYPDVLKFNPIASGHGYEFNDPTLAMLGDLLKTHIAPFCIAEDYDVPVWMTEISSVDPLDASMENGLLWAKTFHEYLTVANVNAFIWWGGAIPAGNNESLIVLDKDRKGYTQTKRYETFGNFTRYISVGSRRIAVDYQADNLLVTAYKNGKDFTIVVINPAGNEIRSNIQVQGVDINNTISGYVTDSDKTWSSISLKSDIPNGFNITVPAKSVVTYTGIANF